MRKVLGSHSQKVAPQKPMGKEKMKVPILKKNYILRKYDIEGSTKIAIYGLYDKKVIEMNGDALFCVKHFSGEYSIEEIADKITRIFNIKRKKALCSVNKIVDELKAQDVIYIKNEKAVEYKFSSLPKLRGVLHHVYIQLTRACNLRCMHCSVDAGTKGQEELTKEEAFDLIDQIYDMMVPSVTISGGEPTLVSYLEDLIEYTSKKPIKVEIMTNGYNIDDTFAKSLVAKGLVHVNISLDGAKEDSHDYLRGVSGSFKKAVNAIKMFKGLGIFVETTTVIHDKNRNEISEIINLCKRLGVDHMKFVPIVPYKRGKKCDFVSSLDCYVNNIRNIFSAYNSSYNQLMRRNISKKIHNNIIFRCGAGNGLLGVSSEGYVHPCNNIENIILGNIRNQSLIEIYNNSNNLRSMYEILSINGSECEQCSILDYCGGGCVMLAYSYYEDYKKCDITRKPYIAELMKERGERNL